jgi:hypothetical protein
VDLKPEDFSLGSRLALLRLFSAVFDPGSSGSPVSRFTDEWEKAPARASGASFLSLPKRFRK